MVPGVSADEFSALATDPEPTHECGLAVDRPLEWAWRCPGCGHNDFEPATGEADDPSRACSTVVGTEPESFYCEHRCQVRVLELRPRRPHRGAILRRLYA